MPNSDEAAGFGQGRLPSELGVNQEEKGLRWSFTTNKVT